MVQLRTAMLKWVKHVNKSREEGKDQESIQSSTSTIQNCYNHTIRKRHNSTDTFPKQTKNTSS